MGAIFAYATQKRFIAKSILFLATVPIAILGNVFRVFVTSLLVYIADVNVTDEPLHSIMGALVFVIALILLFIFGGILKKVFE
jgi:exosortase/archaeosortase family protein